jgi:hypothetical protein
MWLVFFRILLHRGSLGHVLEHIRLCCLHPTRCLSVLSRSFRDVRFDVGGAVVVFVVVFLNITMLFVRWLRNSITAFI